MGMHLLPKWSSPISRLGMPPQVQLKQQIADDTARLEDISLQIKQLTATLGKLAVKHETGVRFVHLSEETIQQFEESLARS